MSDGNEKPPAVGYRSPPLANRFSPGRSGNPKGRPRGSKNTMTVLNAALDERVTVTENGKRRKVTKREVMAKQLVNKATAGDLKAIPIVLVYTNAYEQMQATAAVEQDKLSQADERGIASLIARIQGPLKPIIEIVAQTDPDIANAGSDAEGRPQHV